MQSEDTVSAFNLVGLPDSWTPCFTFGLQLPACVHGEDVMDYVGFRAIPMGWMGTVELLQDVARRLVFRTARVPAGSELLPRGPLPVAEPISVTCLDDCNFIWKVPQGDMSDSAEHERYVAACADLKTPPHFRQTGRAHCRHAVIRKRDPQSHRQSVPTTASLMR